MESIRPNYAEGRFYPSSPRELREQIEDAIIAEKDNIDYSLANHEIIGGIVPHAGYIYCARQAIHFFEIVKRSKQLFDVIIIINPNHTGQGEALSVDEHTHWRTPFGKQPIDRDLAVITKLIPDKLSQQHEHSGEVILPYIQYYFGTDIPILPISFGAQSASNAEIVGKVLYESCRYMKRKPLIIASSDFNHFDTPDRGEQLDNYALDALLKKEPREFERRIKERNISICGYGCILALMAYAKCVSSDYNISILQRGHSGQVLPSAEVVDYISALIYK
ncbi:MAG: AmmeMemoRadiSam system protein B [Marinifilaceae bacterium]